MRTRPDRSVERTGAPASAWTVMENMDLEWQSGSAPPARSLTSVVRREGSEVLNRRKRRERRAAWIFVIFRGFSGSLPGCPGGSDFLSCVWRLWRLDSRRRGMADGRCESGDSGGRVLKRWTVDCQSAERTGARASVWTVTKNRNFDWQSVSAPAAPVAHPRH
jgi:hypothetical protein